MVIMPDPIQATGWRKFVYLWLTLFLNMSVTILTGEQACHENSLQPVA
jgi:hypothetical protein